MESIFVKTAEQEWTVSKMDDITFCLRGMKDCEVIRCERHPHNIMDKTIPHSFAELYETEYCPLEKVERKQGKWEREHPRYGAWRCSMCGCKIDRSNPLKGNIWNFNYCPNCGTDMRGEQDG